MKKNIVILIILSSLCVGALTGCSFIPNKGSEDTEGAVLEDGSELGIYDSGEVMGVYDGSKVPLMKEYRYDLEGNRLWKSGKDNSGMFDIATGYNEVSRETTSKAGAIKSKISEVGSKSGYVSQKITYTVAIAASKDEDTSNPSAMGIPFRRVVADYYTGTEAVVERKDFSKEVEVPQDVSIEASEEDITDGETESTPSVIVETKEVGGYTVDIEGTAYNVEVEYSSPEWGPLVEDDMLGKFGYYTYTQSVTITYPYDYDGACFGIEELCGTAINSATIPDSVENEQGYQRIALSEEGTPFTIDKAHFVRLPKKVIE